MVNKFIVNITSDNYYFMFHAPLTQESVSGTVDWGDGNIDTVNNSAPPMHNYSSSGEYTITFETTDFTTITGGFCANVSSVTEIYIAEGITTLPSGSFYSCYDLKKAYLPSTAVVQGQSFQGCSNLEYVSFGDKNHLNDAENAYAYNNSDAFSGCTSLTTILFYSSNSFSVSDYFSNGSGGYITVIGTKNGSISDDDNEIRDMRIGSHMPSFRHINVERDSKVIWKMALGSRVIWDLKQSKPKDEYLKVNPTLVGAKYLENYEPTAIYTEVYWVHKVNGTMTETYLSYEELNSWTCDNPTIEPKYNNDDTSSYVYTYEINQNSSFGEFDFKITYKSPDTNELLEIEYPSYYLEEVSFDFNGIIVWYPFRNWLTKEDFGNGILNFECRDKKGNLITDNYEIPKNCTYVNYDFSTVKPTNADFSFGESQVIPYLLVSPYTHKEYYDDSVWNIRPFYDERNTIELYKKKINAYEPFKIGININALDYIYKLKEDKILFDGGLDKYYTVNVGSYYEQKVPTDDSNLIASITYYDTDGTTVTNKVDTHVITEEEFININYDKVNIGRTFSAPIMNDNFCEHGLNYVYSGYPASVGYIYWGDNTFSYYASGVHYYFGKNTTDSCFFKNINIQNGYFINSHDDMEMNYIQPFGEDNHENHLYEDDGEYDVLVTSASQSQPTETYHSDTNTKIYNTLSTIVFYENNGYDKVSSNFVYKQWSYVDYGKERNESLIYTVWGNNPTHTSLKIPKSAPQVQVTSLDFGEGMFFGYYRSQYTQNGSVVSSTNYGYYGTHNQTDTGVFVSSTIFDSQPNRSSLDSLYNLESIKIPKINTTELLVNNTSAGNSKLGNISKLQNLFSLKDIYYNGTKADWDSYFTRENGTSYLNEFVDGTDITSTSPEVNHMYLFRNIGANNLYRGDNSNHAKYPWTDTYTVTIHCTDETFSIVLEPNEKWFTPDYSSAKKFAYDWTEKKYVEV